MCLLSWHQKRVLKRAWKCGEKRFGLSREMPEHAIGLQKQTIPRWKQNVRKKFGIWSNSGQNRLEYEGLSVCYPARPCEPNSVMKVSSDSKGYLYLEKYNLRHNPTLASRDVVDNPTGFSLHTFFMSHNLVLMWLAKKKLKCSCFKLRFWTNHILCRKHEIWNCKTQKLDQSRDRG